MAIIQIRDFCPAGEGGGIKYRQGWVYGYRARRGVCREFREIIAITKTLYHPCSWLFQ